MYIRNLLFLLFFGLLPFAIGLPRVTHSAQDSNNTIKEKLREGVQYARKSIDLCISDFATLEIDKYLAEAKKRGVRVRIVIFVQRKSSGIRGLGRALIQKGFDVRIIKNQLNIIQNQTGDFLILDDRILITGVYNWTAYRNRNAYDYVLFHYNKDKARAYKNNFYQLFAEGKNATRYYEKQKVEKNSQKKQVVNNRASEALVNQENRKEAGQTSKYDSEKTSKEFVDVSFEELNKLLGSESTLSGTEKKRLWQKKYKGKYVRWSGTVLFKGISRMNWNRAGISQQNNDNTDVIIFFHWKMRNHLMNLRVGTKITYTGKLVSRPRLSSSFRLQDGMIE